MKQKIQFKSLFKIIIIFFILIINLTSFPFQKKVWVFWNSDIHQAPLIVQLCHQKIQRIASQNDYQFIFLHSNNLKDYISNYNSTFLKVLKNSQRKSQQADSDLIRISIIQQHGGIYFDLSTILFNDYGLKWLQNLDNFQNLIINKFGNNLQVLFFTYCNYQSNIIQRNQEGLLINENPGFQIWFIAAKKKAQLLVDWKKNYYNFTQIGFSKYNKLISDEDIFIKNVDKGESYWSANIALYYTLQKKQKQLDKKIRFNQGMPRLSVNEYYKIWGIHGQNGPLVFIRTNHIKQENIFEQTLQQVQQRTGQLNFFLKMNGISRKCINQYIKELTNIYKDLTFDFDQYLQKEPNPEDCTKLKFITKGSLIDKELIQNSQIAKQLNLGTIDVKQRQKWRQYCKIYTIKKQQKWSYLDFLIKQQPVGEFSKIQQIRSQTFYSFFDSFKNFLYFNSFIIDYVKFFIVQVILFLSIVYLTYKIALKKIQKSQNIKVNVEIYKINHQTGKQFSQNNTIQIFLFSFILFCQIIIGILIVYCLQHFNYIPFNLETLIYIVYVVFSQILIKYFIQANYKFYFIKKIFQIFQIPINYFICYFVLSTIQNRLQYKIIHTIFISLIGSSIYNIALKLYQKNKSVNKLLKILISHLGYHKFIVLIFYLGINLVPNIKFIVFNDRYLITYSIYIPLIYVSLLLLSVIYQFSKNYTKNNAYNNIKVTFLFIILSFLMLWFVFYKILNVKHWHTRVYNLSLVTAFSYLYLLSNRKIPEIQKHKQFIKLSKNQYIYTYAFLFFYLFLGTYWFNYQSLQFLYLFQTFGFLINIGIYIASQEIFLQKAFSIYQIVEKNQQNQRLN